MASNWKNNLPLKVSTTTRPKEMLENFSLFRVHPQNLQQTFYAVGQPKQNTHLFLHISWSLLVATWHNNSFLNKKNSKVRKLKKLRNFWKYLHSPNCEFWVVFLFHDIFWKTSFHHQPSRYTQAAPSCFFFSVGAVTGGHAGRLSWLETPQHPQVAPVGMGRCISGKNVKFDKIPGTCG